MSLDLSLKTSAGTSGVKSDAKNGASGELGKRPEAPQSTEAILNEAVATP